MFASAAFLLLAGIAQAQEVLFSASNYRATFYYDLDTSTDVCSSAKGGPAAANWAVDTGINGGVTWCQGDNTAWTLNSLNTNRIVAMNHTMMNGDRSLCGKEVQIFDSTGKQITIDEGPFVLMDACDACVSTGIIDLSAKAFAAVKGGTCSGNNPEGLTVKILNNNVSPSGGASGGSPAATGGAAAPAASSAAPESSAPAVETPASVAPTATSVAPETPAAETTTSTTVETPSPSATYSIRGTNAWWSASVAPSAAVTPTSTTLDHGVLAAAPTNAPAPTAVSAAIPEAEKDAQVNAGVSCQYGKWSCDGKAIQVCSYNQNGKLSWITTGECDNACNVSGSGSITCA